MPLPIAAAIGITAASTAINQGLATYNANKQQQFAQENMKLANAMSRQNLVDAPSAHIDGLKRAGLSPLHDGEFTPAAAPAAASAPNIDSPKFDGMSSLIQAATIENMQAQNENLKAQNANIEANTAKTRAETSNIEQTTGITKEQDNEAKESYSRAVDRLLQQYPNDDGLQYLSDILHSDRPLGLGGIRAEIEALNAEKLLSRNLKEDVGDALDRLIYENKLDNGTAKIEADMPRLGYNLQKAQLANTIKTLSLLNEQISNTHADTQKIGAEIKKLEEERHNIAMHTDYLRKNGYLSEVQADLIRNGDFNTLFKEGDKTGAAVAGSSKLIQLLTGVLKMLK